MTKKKITTAKKTPQKAKSSVAKAAANKATKAKPATPKNNAAKTKKVAKSVAPKRTTRTKIQSSNSKSTAKKQEGVGESKVKEIATKSKSKIVEKKKETRGFSLDDVRQILQIKTKKKEKSPKVDAAESKATSSTTKKSKSPAKKKVAKVKKIQTASIGDILGFGPVTTSSRPIRDENKVPKEWLPYYKNLMELRASLKGALGERSQDTLGASARESSGELSLNSPDAGSDTFNRDVALSMVANEQEALEEIEDAIDRIFDGTFGICQETQKPIKKARLKVVPFTRFSLEGQTMYEKRDRKDRDSGGGAFATISDSTMGVEE